MKEATGFRQAVGMTLLAALATAPGCLSSSSESLPVAGAPAPSAERSLAMGLPLPTKDEVVLVDGRPLSITGFMAIRSQMTHPSTESVFWAGVAALALQSDSHARGVELPVDSALLIARYALRDAPGTSAEASLKQFFGASRAVLPTPEETRREIDRIVSHAVVQRNPQVLAELR